MDIGVLEYGLLGLVFAIVMALIELLKFTITKYSKNGNNGNNGSSKKNSDQDVQIAIFATQLAEIKNNHLVHINDELDKNRSDHESMMAKLAGIDAKIEFLINKK